MVARNGGKLNASSSLLLLAGMSRGVLQEANDDDTMAENAFSPELRVDRTEMKVEIPKRY